MSTTEGDMGAIVQSSKETYTVGVLLGEGGFGAVLKVNPQSDPNKVYAMKVEKATRKHSKLRMEIAILKLVTEERGEKSHFTKIVDRGKKKDYVFLVMELVGKSLADLKNERPKRVFSLNTGIGTAIQCLEAVEDLHKYFFIHRDLKPANYIYILDFGIARRITNDKDELKTPRQFVNFKGTIRFASRACHHNRELGFNADCESWFYLLLGLPWRKLDKKEEVLEMKEKCRTDMRNKLAPGLPCEAQFLKIMDYIDKLSYEDKVDYGYIYGMLNEIGKVDINAPYDWEIPKDNTKSSKSKKKH